MRDLPHHIKKLNSKVIRSMRREANENVLPEMPEWPATKQEQRKKEKVQIKSRRAAHIPSDLEPEERNKIMRKGRVPVFDRINNAKPKGTRRSKKKTPRI